MRAKKVMYCPPPKSYRNRAANADEHETEYYHQEPTSSTGKIIMGAIAGVGLGAIAALLLAPDKGKNTRNNISKYLSDYSGNMEQIFANGRTKLEYLFEELQHSKRSREIKAAQQANQPGQVNNMQANNMETPTTANSLPGGTSNSDLGTRGIIESDV